MDPAPWKTPRPCRHFRAWRQDPLPPPPRFDMKSLPFIPLPLLLLILLFLGGPAPLRAVGLWHRDYPEARAEAKAQGKLLLIVFTATDWVEICQKFYDDILGQPEFIEAVSGTFALV